MIRKATHNVVPLAQSQSKFDWEAASKIIDEIENHADDDLTDDEAAERRLAVARCCDIVQQWGKKFGGVAFVSMMKSIGN